MIGINFKPFGHWLYDFWKQKEETFIDYIGYKYYFNQENRSRLLYVCKQVNYRGRFDAEELIQIQELGIPFIRIGGLNLNGFRERTSPISYDTFVTYLVNICDNKFTKEQIKQTIENDSIASKSNNIK